MKVVERSMTLKFYGVEPWWERIDELLSPLEQTNQDHIFISIEKVATSNEGGYEEGFFHSLEVYLQLRFYSRFTTCD